MSLEPHPNPAPEAEPLRPHVYDGIQEYNKKLPNWWLMTFYGAIVFAVGYWACYQWWKALPDEATVVTRELAKIETKKLAALATLDDASLWQMSRNATFVKAGEAVFQNCVACHGANLQGVVGTGAPSLVDSVWIHGGKPTDVYNTITKGVAAKGMPTWGPVLGAKKITEVTAFVMSHHPPPAP